MYVYSNIKTKEEKEKFLRLGSDWWWSTNRTIPINIILEHRFHQFRYCLRTFNSKEFDIKIGPNLSLKNIITKRVKRKNIQLIRKES